MSFRPYGAEDNRVVSDLSRFDFEQVTRNRSRNTTPTSLEGDDKSSDYTLDNIIPYYDSNPRSERPQYRHPNPQQKTLLQIAEDHPELYQPKIRPPPPPKDDRGLGRSKSSKSFAPYPPSVFMSVPYERTKFTNDLPAEMEPTEYLHRQPTNNPNDIPGNDRPNDDIQSINAKSKQLEEDLVRRVMHHPLYVFNGSELGIPKYENQEVILSVNEVLYFFQMIFNIIVIVLASILSNVDHRISAGIYRYFIADSILSLLVCFMFIANIINFEKRNGSFYCLTALLLNLASFIIVLSYIIPKRNCQSESICNMRLACSSFIIFSTMIWLCNMVVFLTTLYISRLNLLDDINFDFSNRGVRSNFNHQNISQDTLIQEQTPKELKQQEKQRQLQQDYEKTKEPPLKEYYLNEKGEMYELVNEFEKEQHKDKNKILVYTF